MSYVGTGREQRNAEDRGRRTHHFTALLPDSSGFLAENRAVMMPIKIIGSAHSSGRGHPSQEPIYKTAQRSRLNHTFVLHLKIPLWKLYAIARVIATHNFSVHGTENMCGGVQTQASSERLHCCSLKAGPRPTGMQKKRKQTRTGEGHGTT